MNAAKAIEIVAGCLYVIREDVPEYAKGYLAALEGEEVWTLVKALKEIVNRTSWNCDCKGSDGCNCDFRFAQSTAENALSIFKEKKKPNA